MADSTVTINPLDVFQWNTSGTNTVTANGNYVITTTGGTTATTAYLNPNMIYGSSTSVNGWQAQFVSVDESPVESAPADPWEAAIHKASQMMKNG
jgi:beta-galactosidase/beta-glucuronidase